MKLSSGCYLGTVLNRKQYEGVYLTRTCHSKGNWLPLHSHQNAYFCFIRQGFYSEKIGSQIRQCNPGMLVFHPPGETHSERIESEQSHSLNIEMDQVWLKRLLAERYATLISCELRQPNWSLLAHQLYREFSQYDSVSSLVVQGLTMQLLSGIFRQVPKKNRSLPPWLTKVREFVQDQFRDSLDLKSMAAVAGVHPVYLVQRFRLAYGVTPGEFQRQMRVDWACRQLTETRTPIGTIAIMAGFSDQSHLARQVKKRTGLSPRTLRNSAFKSS